MEAASGRGWKEGVEIQSLTNLSDNLGGGGGEGGGGEGGGGEKGGEEDEDEER